MVLNDSILVLCESKGAHSLFFLSFRTFKDLQFYKQIVGRDLFLEARYLPLALGSNGELVHKHTLTKECYEIFMMCSTVE